MQSAQAGRIPCWLLPLFVLAFDLGLVLFVQSPGPVRDELNFYPAAKVFADAGVFPSLDFWRSYPAPQTPLSFYLAGRVLALLPSLRLLRLANCALMFTALLRFSSCARQRCGDNAQLASALIAFNPYFHLVATHFYTDALYFWLVVQVLTRAPSQSKWLPLTLLPLVRQFGIIYPLGEALHDLIQRRLRKAALTLLTLLPMLALFALWQGVAPNTPLARIPTSVHRVYGWFFPYVVSYHLAALGFYLAPVAWRIEHTQRFFWFGLAFSVGYLLAPAHANFSAQLADSGIATLGCFHKATLLLGPRAAHIPLCIFAFVGGGLLGEALAVPSAAAYFVLWFVVLSLFSFQAWDKYLLDVLPSALFAILARPTATNARLPAPVG